MRGQAICEWTSIPASKQPIPSRRSSNYWNQTKPTLCARPLELHHEFEWPVPEAFVSLPSEDSERVRPPNKAFSAIRTRFHQLSGIPSLFRGPLVYRCPAELRCGIPEPQK